MTTMCHPRRCVRIPPDVGRVPAPSEADHRRDERAMGRPPAQRELLSLLGLLGPAGPFSLARLSPCAALGAFAT